LSQIDVTVTGIPGAPYHFSFATGSDPDVLSPVANIWPPDELSPVPSSFLSASASMSG